MTAYPCKSNPILCCLPGEWCPCCAQRQRQARNQKWSQWCSWFFWLHICPCRCLAWRAEPSLNSMNMMWKQYLGLGWLSNLVDKIFITVYVGSWFGFTLSWTIKCHKTTSEFSDRCIFWQWSLGDWKNLGSGGGWEEPERLLPTGTTHSVSPSHYLVSHRPCWTSFRTWHSRSLLGSWIPCSAKGSVRTIRWRSTAYYQNQKRKGVLPLVEHTGLPTEERQVFPVLDLVMWRHGFTWE